MSRFAALLSCWCLIALGGCQCCWMTEHYAQHIDNIADHEHCFEAIYSPRFDLNRIGRCDWCSYGLHRVCCSRACNRCKPAPCGYCVVAETGRIVENPVSQPDWSTESLPPMEPTEALPNDSSDDAAEGHLLPPPPAPASESTEE